MTYKTLTLAFLGLTAQIFADYTIKDRELRASDLSAERQAFHTFERDLRPAFAGIQEEIEAIRAEISAPFEVEIDRLEAEKRPFEAEIGRIHRRTDEFARTRRRITREAEESAERILTDHSRHFERLITERLAPVQPRLDELRQAEEEINERFRSFEKEFRGGLDALDYMDRDFRLRRVRNEREALTTPRIAGLLAERDLLSQEIQGRFAIFREEISALEPLVRQNNEAEISGIRRRIIPTEEAISNVRRNAYDELERVFAERGLNKDLVRDLLGRDPIQLLPNFFEDFIAPRIERPQATAGAGAAAAAS